VGLVQRVIEEAGIATVSISQVSKVTERVRPPRALFLNWPFGHALGEPGNALQHRRVLWEMLKDVRERPRAAAGEVRELTLRWRRETYAPADFAALDGDIPADSR
jgi:D-proline reductase (dithiol) PrdB